MPWPFLSSVLDTASAGARSMALWVLSLEEEVGDCDLFLSLLEDSLVQARAGLRATVLENIAVRAGGDKEALDVLVEALADEDADVRRASAWGLGKVETDPHARLTLLRTLGDTSLIVRTATRLSLERDSLLGSREVLNEVTAQEENRGAASRVAFALRRPLARIGPRSGSAHAGGSGPRAGARFLAPRAGS